MLTQISDITVDMAIQAREAVIEFVRIIEADGEKTCFV